MAIKVEYRQNGAGERDGLLMPPVDGFTHSFVWDGDIGKTVKCCNPLCKGSYYLGFEIEKFARGNEPVATCLLVCHGSESSPKGRVVYRNCANTLRYRFRRVEDRPQSGAE